MTQKEIENISLHVAILMQAVLDVNSTPEETANYAITFAKQFFCEFPKIKETVGDILDSFDENDPNFNLKWDLNIEWIKNWSKSV